ncbi:hypothetical protein MJO28_012913 [Puccinia striiformis f. sp. tritici]|uniref:Uncharacterized protein n=1 Tax=Puccinia striiformis f. sp. tritici TaxID=168172 RepID=A0ACC0DYR9_9BASI|nr:hypothetical protein MJO28_012913 [Puccinia striiformis f. sp. tritici]
MVKIQNEDRDLGFNGTNVEEFLYWYQKAAKEDGASEYDMACQLICFVRSNEVYDIIEICEGYINCNWPELRVSMIFYWGRLDIPRFTRQDLEALVCSWSTKEASFSLQECQVFRKFWDPIALYVLRDESIDTIDKISEMLQSLEHQLKNQSAPSQPPVELVEPQEFTSLKSPSIPLSPCFGTAQDATLSVLESDEEERDIKTNFSERLIAEPSQAEGLLFTPGSSPKSLSLSMFCFEEEITKDHFNVLDGGLCEIPNAEVSDVVLSELLEEFSTPVSDPVLGRFSCPLGFRTFPIPNDQPVEVTRVEERIFLLDPTRPEIIQPVFLSQFKNNLNQMEESAGLGEDHNHFMDIIDPLDHSLNSDSLIFGSTLIHDQELKHSPDSVNTISSTQNSDRQKISNTTKIIQGISSPLACSHLSSTSSDLATLRDEHKLPSFGFEEEASTFSNQFSTLQLTNDQDLSFQDSPQDFLRDEDKLIFFQLSSSCCVAIFGQNLSI